MAEPFQSLTHPREIEFATTLVQPPTAFYISQEERLRLRTIGTTAGRAFSLTVRLLLPDGTVQIITGSYTMAATYTYEYFYVALAEGFLLSLQTTTADAISGRGELYLSVDLVRGTNTQPTLVATLCSGYLTQNYGPSWPIGGVESPSVGPGVPLEKSAPDPGAGLDCVLPVPFGVRWRIQSIRVQLQTDATVANRFVGLRVTHPPVNMLIAISALTQAAGLTVVYVLGPPSSYQAASVIPNQVVPLPANLLVSSGASLTLVTIGGVAGDILSQGRFLVEEWKE